MTKFFKRYFNEVRSSIYDPDYYERLSERRLSGSFRYFFVFGLLLVLLMTAVFSARVIPGLRPFVNSVSQRVLEYYPDELEITIAGGMASTNVEEPYYLALPEAFKVGETGMIRNLIVLDTKNDFSQERYREYQTFALLTKDSIAYLQNNQVVLAPLSRIPDYVLTKDKVRGVVTAVQPYVKFVAPLLVLGVFAASYLIFISKLLYLLLGALIIILLARLRGQTIRYAKAYQVGLHAITLPTLAQYVFLLLGLPLIIPLGYTLLFAVGAYLNLKSVQTSAPQQKLPLK